MWHLSRLVSWKVGHFHIYHCGQHVVLCVCSEIQILRCVIYDVVTLLVAWLLWIYSAHSWSDKYVFCVAVSEWRRTKQQRLTCITAPIVRSLMGHLSVSYHCLSIPFFICHDFIGLHINVNLNLCVFFFSVRKRRGGHKQTDTTAGTRDPSRPVKTGSPQFVRELRSRTFPK